ncbi:MAG: nucleoside triphosphate pyrophosphatase [Methylomicrobium sp.]
MKPNPLILASSSRFRQELLKKLHLNFSAVSPDIDEKPWPHESPQDTAIRLSESKARALFDRYPEHLIIGSDQVAVLNDTRLGKPGNRENTIAQLTACSGNSVTFFTGVALADSSTGTVVSAVDECRVYFRKLTLAQIQRYVDLEKPYDCAGGFKSESLGIALFDKIEGDDPNALIGLPLIKLIGLLTTFGYDVLA